MKRTIAITCTALIIGAILLLALPINLPLPFRLALAFLDLVAAATLSKTKGDSIDSCAIDSPPTSRVTNFTPTGADPVTASA